MPWISNKTLHNIEQRREAKKTFGKQSEQYKDWNKEVKNAIKNDMKEYLESHLSHIEICNLTHSSREMYSGINRLMRNFTPRLSDIKDKDGKTLTENEEISNRWKEDCSEMYEDNTNEEMKQVESNDEILEPTRSEVEWAIKQLPKGKSADNDEIHAEMIKASGEQGIDIFHKLCKKIWIEEKWPDEWVKSVFVPIPKKGDLQQCSNYRTIALISHASKILLKIIMKRLEKKIEEEVSQTQAGFRRNRGTRDQIFNLRMIIEKCRESNTELHLGFIDYTKAFDCVSHHKMIEILKKYNCHFKIINLIKNSGTHGKWKHRMVPSKKGS
ncbi:endonuclease-reverse transcriptase [Elysia marginata]|uniref:Endonuclease-reverse transcriptase n=1 Tax=Elysia marginata TaxID=1093978 RepID=A0AAV4FHA0_9GAST|nr:endonuclease-reverse transcriptase [Elysia marginata]